MDRMSKELINDVESMNHNASVENKHIQNNAKRKIHTFINEDSSLREVQNSINMRPKDFCRRS